MRGLGVIVAAALAAGAAEALAAGAAEAATVTFRVSGMCQTNCDRVGGFEGEVVGGRVVLDDAGFAPGGPIDASAFVDFLIIFGDVDNGPTTTPVFGASGVWGATPDDPAIGLRLAAGPVGPELGSAFAFSGLIPRRPDALRSFQTPGSRRSNEARAHRAGWIAVGKAAPWSRHGCTAGSRGRLCDG
jgi:hypothetical protein